MREGDNQIGNANYLLGIFVERSLFLLTVLANVESEQIPTIMVVESRLLLIALTVLGYR